MAESEDAQVTESVGTAITLEASADRLTPVEQLQQALELAREKREPLRLRVACQVYDLPSRTYGNVRDAIWRLTVPAETSAEAVKGMIDAVQLALETLAAVGAEELEGRLRG